MESSRSAAAGFGLRKLSLPRLAVLSMAAATLAVVWFVNVRERPTNVVLITLDTTRADRLSPYGFMDASMPALERLAKEGVVFDQAITPAPLTLPAHASLFTGLNPPRHGARDNAATPLAAATTTLAEVLTAQGYCSAAFVGSAVLDAGRGLAQGFQQYGSAGRLQRPANEVVDQALAWLAAEAHDGFFLWVHLYDPHMPYEPPAPYRSKYFNPYIGELAFVDSQLGRLLAALDERGVTDSTLVIAAGDHGEALGDHGEATHGRTLYESVLRVPMIVRLPNAAGRVRSAGSRVPEVVRLLDIMPTVLDLLGFQGPETDGVSLLGRMRGDPTPLALDAFAESLYAAQFAGSPLASLRDDRYKFILAPEPELYDLARDPFEAHNLASDHAPIASAMAKAIAALRSESVDANAVPSTTSPEVRDRLRALGYVDASPPSGAHSSRRLRQR